MVRTTQYVPLTTNDTQLTLIQAQVGKAFAPLTSNPLMNGVAVTVTFTASDADTNVDHNLGSHKVGYLLGACGAPTAVYVSPNGGTKNTIVLRASEPATVTVYCYVEAS